MKLHSFLVLCLATTLILTSCEEKQILPGDNSRNQDSIYVVPPMPDPDGADIPEGTLTVSEALAICASLEKGAETAEEYYVKGWICSQDASKNADAIKQYGNVYFYMGVSKLSEIENSLYAYQVYGLNGQPVKVPEAIAVGDFVVIKCHLTNFNGTYETVGKGDASIYFTTNPNINKRPASIEITCAEAKEIAMALPENNVPTEEYYCVSGYITNVSGSVSRGQQTFWMDDQPGTTKTLQGYWANVPDGETPFEVGQHIKMYGHLLKYNTTAEIKNGDVEFIVE